MQFCATRRKCEMAETPSVCHAVQSGGMTRKNSVLNYESPALTAELQARISYAFKHSILLLTNRESVADRLNLGLRIADLGWNGDSRNPKHHRDRNSQRACGKLTLRRWGWAGAWSNGRCDRRRDCRARSCSSSR
jgi:hypothetical protein